MATAEVDNKTSQELKAQLKYIKEEIHNLTCAPILRNLAYYSSSSPSSDDSDSDDSDSDSDSDNPIDNDNHELTEESTSIIITNESINNFNNSNHESTEESTSIVITNESINNFDNSNNNSDNNNNHKTAEESTTTIITNKPLNNLDNCNETTDFILTKEPITEPIIINDDPSITQIPCYSKDYTDNINTTTINKARTIAREKYPKKRKLNNIKQGVQRNVKIQKEDKIEQTLKTLITHMEKMDKRLDQLENKFANKELNTEDNARKNIQEGDIPSQIKKTRSQVIIAFRDFWMPVMTKRFDSIESRFDSIEESLESIMKKVRIYILRL